MLGRDLLPVIDVKAWPDKTERGEVLCSISSFHPAGQLRDAKGKLIEGFVASISDERAKIDEQGRVTRPATLTLVTPTTTLVLRFRFTLSMDGGFAAAAPGSLSGRADIACEEMSFTPTESGKEEWESGTH